MAEAERFRCLRCYHCCYFSSEGEAPTVLPWEKRLLSSLLSSLGTSKAKRATFKPLLVFEDSRGTCIVALYKFSIRGFCPFFDVHSRSCSIHEVKPLACRMYPLVLEVSSGKVMVSSKCSWVKRNPWIKSLDADSLLKVFPKEIESVLEAFVHAKTINEVSEELNLKPLAQGTSKCRRIVDLDSYVAHVGW